MNIDQTGIILIPIANNVTYSIKRVKQVFFYGKDKKHTFITVLLGSCKCKVLSI